VLNDQREAAMETLILVVPAGIAALVLMIWITVKEEESETKSKRKQPQDRKKFWNLF
jgi:hypothetical protein